MQIKSITKVLAVILVSACLGSSMVGCSMFTETPPPIEPINELIVNAGEDVSFLTQEYEIEHRGNYDVLIFNDEATALAAQQECYNNMIYPDVNVDAELCGFGDLSLISYASKNNIAKTAGEVVVIVDSGASADHANERYTVLGGTNYDCEDSAKHGDKTCDYILNCDANNAYIISIKAFGSSGESDTVNILAALEFIVANNLNPDYLLLPFSMRVQQDSIGDFQALISLLSSIRNGGCTVVTSAGNDNHDDVSKVMPANASSNNIVIGSKKADGTGTVTSRDITASTNVGSQVDYWVTASSTSEAAAKYVGYAIAGNISGNRAIQTGLIRYSAPQPGHNDLVEKYGNCQETAWSEDSIRGAGYASSDEFANNILAACQWMTGSSPSDASVAYGGEGHTYTHGRADCITFTHIAYTYAYNQPSGIPRPLVNDNHNLRGIWNSTSELAGWINSNGYGSMSTRTNEYNVPDNSVDLYPMNGSTGVRAWASAEGLGYMPNNRPYAPVNTRILFLDPTEEPPADYNGLYIRPGDMIIMRNSSIFHHAIIYGGRSDNKVKTYGATTWGKNAVYKVRNGLVLQDLIWDSIDDGEDDATFGLNDDAGGDVGFYIIHYAPFGGCAYADMNKTFDLQEYNDLCEAYGEDYVLSHITIEASSATTNTSSFYYGQKPNDNNTPLLVVAPGQTITSITLAEMRKTISGDQVIFSWPDSYWGSGSSRMTLPGFGPIWKWEGDDPPQITFTETWAFDATYPQ